MTKWLILLIKCYRPIRPTWKKKKKTTYRIHFYHSRLASSIFFLWWLKFSIKNKEEKLDSFQSHRVLSLLADRPRSTWQRRSSVKGSFQSHHQQDRGVLHVLFNLIYLSWRSQSYPWRKIYNKSLYDGGKIVKPNIVNTSMCGSIKGVTTGYILPISYSVLLP